MTPEFFTISMLNGVSYGLLLFMLSSGLTLIFSMMGVLNFAHTSFYMLGAYFAYTLSGVVGFWPALFICPLLVGGYLLFTFLGGATFFFGPIIGAVLLVLASVLLSELTKAWLLYLGLVFLLMVMYAPGGVASLFMMNLRVAKFGHFKRLIEPYLGVLAAGVVTLVGAASLIEMIYHMQLNAALGPKVPFMGAELDTSAASTWTVAIVVFVVGLGLLEGVRRLTARRWGRIQEAIEESIKKGEG